MLGHDSRVEGVRQGSPPGIPDLFHYIDLSILYDMPSYDFVCADCGASFDVRLSMSAYEAGEGRVCTRCSSTRVERAYTAVNVIAGGRSGGNGYGSGGCHGGSGFT